MADHLTGNIIRMVTRTLGASRPRFLVGLEALLETWWLAQIGHWRPMITMIPITTTRMVRITMLQVAFKFAQTKMWQICTTLCAWKSNESDPIPSPFFPQPGSRLVVTDRLLGENIQHGCWQAGEVSVSQLNQVWPNSAEGPYLNTYKYLAPCQREVLGGGPLNSVRIILGDFYRTQVNLGSDLWVRMSVSHVFET